MNFMWEKPMTDHWRSFVPPFWYKVFAQSYKMTNPTASKSVWLRPTCRCDSHHHHRCDSHRLRGNGQVHFDQFGHRLDHLRKDDIYPYSTSSANVHLYPPRTPTCIHHVLALVSSSVSHPYLPSPLTRINLGLSLVISLAVTTDRTVKWCLWEAGRHDCQRKVHTKEA